MNLVPSCLKNKKQINQKTKVALEQKRKIICLLNITKTKEIISNIKAILASYKLS